MERKELPPVNTYSRSSPQGVEYGCLCPDNSYHPDCCNGDIYAQGVGQLTLGHLSTITNTAVPRNTSNTHG